MLIKARSNYIWFEYGNTWSFPHFAFQKSIGFVPLEFHYSLSFFFFLCRADCSRLNGGLQQNLSKSEPPEPTSVNLPGKRIFAEVFNLRILKWDYPGFRVKLKSSDWWLYKRMERESWDTWTQRHTGKDHVRTQAEIGAVLLQAKECQEPWEAGRGKIGSSPRASEGVLPCWHPDYTSGLQNKDRNTLPLF